MATKTPKKKESRERAVSSTGPKSAPEQTASQGLGNDKDEKGRKGPNKSPISIWPEWSDNDIGAEKWDIPHKGKDKEKGKSPNLHAFEDPEGRIDLPLVIQSKVECWKRPVDFIEDKAPVVVDVESLKEKDIDLLSFSTYCTDSEVMRWIIADITNLTKLKPKIESIEVKSLKEAKDKDKTEIVPNEELIWKPWQHIWPKEKNKNGVYPVYNPGGKYVVKIFWMGLWRKITVDDWMPFNSEGAMLLPSSKRTNELWPMLLAKALLKVASLDHHGAKKPCEFGDFNVVQCLTGWMPEIIPLRREHSDDLWEVLGKIIPLWKLENSAPTAAEQKEVVNVKKKDETAKKVREKQERSFTSQNTNSERSFERESRLRDIKDSKDKFLANGSSSILKDVAKEPEFAVFASYSNPPASPTTLSVLTEMADASEKLRQSGLSHNHPHPVMVTLLRNCPLVAPPPPVEIPRWKLIRQKKRKQPRDPRLTPVDPPKEPKFLEVTSPFVSYCVSPTPVGSMKTPSLKFQPDAENMSEIAEEGDKMEEVNVPEKLAEVEQTEEQKVEEVISVELPPKVPEPTKLTPSRVDKTDDKKETGKVSKERVRSARSDRSSSNTQEKEGKQGKGRKISKSEQEKKTETQVKSSGGRRVSKTDIKGLPEKDSRKSGKSEKDAKNIDTDSSSVLDDNVQDVVEGEDGGEKTEECLEEGNETKNKEKKFWIEYDEFWKCFSTLFIYHKPLTYTFNKSHLELKNVSLTNHVKKSGTGLHTASAATAAVTAKGLGVPPSPVGHHGLAGIPIDPPPPFLFVDSVNPIEIVVCFTSFSKWLDPPLPIFRDKNKDGSNPDIKVDSIIDCSSPVPPTPGLLVAEPYSWKSLVTGQPCLRMKTTGSKAAVLALPPGRHVLRFLLQSPNGYHIGLCSQTQFTFGDEDLVMACLLKESCRFIEQTTGILQNIGNVTTSFGELSTSEKHTILDLGLKDESTEIQERYYKVFMICLRETLSSQLGEEYTRDTHFAWKAFDFIARVYLKERFSFRPRSSADVARIGSVHKKQSDISRTLSHHQEQPLNDDLAATRIQATYRGYYVRKLNNAYRADFAIHQQVNEQLTKSWTAMEANLETYAIHLFRKMFKLDPGLFPLFPFYKDEWTRVTYMDYNGGFVEQPGNHWFLLFREVFYVDEDTLMVPKMYTNIPTCFLRVVNNDTFEEIPKVFQRVAPYNFQKNKRGYTFLAEARSLMTPIPAGKFRLRLIGSTDPLPAPEGENVNSHFVTKEIRDYYIPNKDHVLFRYSVQVTEDLLISIQLCTSKPDVFIKLQVLDNEQEVCSCQGRGHTVLPVYIVRRDRQVGDEDTKRRKKGSRPASKDSSKDGRPPSGRATTAGKSQKSKSKKSSGKETSPGHSRPSSGQDKRDVHGITQEDDLKPQVHKYIIQALVLRDSWPLTRENWDFIQAQKNAEKQDDISTSENTTRSEKSASKGKKGKDGKESRSSKNQPGSRPASQQLQCDTTKPNWTLRIISDASFADDIDIKRDTERQDEIKAMKAAWEAAEPGRAAKAQQSRQKFLNENLIKITSDNENEPVDQEDEPEVEVKSSSLSAIVGDTEELFNEPPPRQPSRILKPFDITPFIRCEGERIVLDEQEEKKLREKRQEMFRQYKTWRDSVVRRREIDRIERNKAKERQIQQAEEWQASLDKIREDINTTREAYRQTFIIHEPPKEEPVEVVARTPSPTKGRKGSKSPKTGRKSPKTKKK